MTRVMMIQIVLDLHAQTTQQGRATLTPIIATTGAPTVTAMLIMLVMLITVMVTVRNFKNPCSLDFFSVFFLSKNYFRNTNKFGQNQARSFVGSDLGPICLQRL